MAVDRRAEEAREPARKVRGLVSQRAGQVAEGGELVAVDRRDRTAEVDQPVSGELVEARERRSRHELHDEPVATAGGARPKHAGNRDRAHLREQVVDREHLRRHQRPDPEQRVEAAPERPPDMLGAEGAHDDVLTGRAHAEHGAAVILEAGIELDLLEDGLVEQLLQVGAKSGHAARAR